MLLSAESDTSDYPPKKVFYFKQVEAAYLKVLVPGETFEQFAGKFHQLEQNPIPLYNAQPLRNWTWSASEARYLTGSA